MHADVAALFVVWVITNQWQCEYSIIAVCVSTIILAKILGGAPAPPAPLPTPLLSSLPFLDLVSKLAEIMLFDQQHKTDFQSLVVVGIFFVEKFPSGREIRRSHG